MPWPRVRGYPPEAALVCPEGLSRAAYNRWITMSALVSTTDIARATLHRLAELELSPTPENYARFYYEISGETAPDCPLHAEAPSVTCSQLVQILRSVVDSVADKTAGLATHLSEHNEDMRQSIDELASTQEKDEILQLLGSIVTKANSIHTTVADSHDDLLATKLALEHVKSELQETRQMLHEDALTGAKNRRAMDAVLAREVARFRRSGARLTVAMIDIDHFKAVNDEYGHDAGDKLLLHLTMVVKSVLREADVLVRYGGEEFLLVLPDTDTQGAEFVLDRLRLVVQKSPLQYEKNSIRVTFSGGIAQLLPDENGHSLIMRADAAMYEAKHAGRDCFRVAH